MSNVAVHIVSDHVACKAGIAKIFLADIIRQLRLVEPNSTTISTPLRHVAKRVLHKEAVHGDIIADDLQTCLTWVLTVHCEMIFVFLWVIDSLRWLIRVKL